MSNILLKLIRFGIGIILFIPLYIGGAFYFPFIFPKIWIFQMIVEIIFFLYVILALSDSRYRPKFGLAAKAVIFLTLILILTSLTGVDAFRSFWGNTERMSGIIAWIHFAVFAVILSAIFKTGKEWRNFLGIAVFVSVLEFFYVLGQYLNLPVVMFPSSRAGTIGNADLLGSYAIFGAFFALYLWRQSEEGKLKWIWAAAFFANAATMFIASSRGAIAGFGIGLAAYAVFNIWHNKKAVKIWLAVAAAIVLVYGVLWLARGAAFVKSNDQLTRLANFSLKSDTAQQRFTEWGIAWSAFKARPIFGFGPNNYLYLHNLYLNPRVYNLRETNFDRAHNAYLDYASMSGVFGLAGYLFLIAVLFWIFWKNEIKTMAALVAAYAIQSFFVFDSPASYISLFFLIGLAMYAESVKVQNTNTGTGGRNPASPQIRTAVWLILLPVMIYIFWQVSVAPAAANTEFVRAFNDSSLSPDEAFALYKQSLARETLGTTEFRNQYINWIQKVIGNFKPEERLAVLDFGIGELEKEVRDHPMVFSYMDLGQMYYLKAGGLTDPAAKAEYFRKAAENYDKAIAIAPKRLEVYYNYLQLALTEKNYDLGIGMMEKAAAAAPDYPKNWWYLGIANIAAGKNDDGIRAANKALAIYYAPNVEITGDGLNLEYDIEKVLRDRSSAPPSTQEILGVVGSYIGEKKYKELLLLYLAAEMNNPNDVGVHQSLALVYHNLGMNDKALEEMKIVDSLKNKQ